MKKKIIAGLGIALLIVAIVLIILFVIVKPFGSKHAHTLEHTSAVEATCTEDGNKEYWYCSDCDKYFSDEDAKTEITKDDTVVKAKGHTEVADAAVAATCTETGLTEGKHCSVCGAVIKAQEVVPALGHSWNDGEVTTEATCTEDGEKTYTCTVCKETKTEAIAALGHTEVTDEAVAPTCTETGLTEGSYCSVCNTVIKAQKEVLATGHSWDDGEVTTEATCTEDGEKTYTCTVCKKTKTETISASGHTEVTDEAVAPTCTETGLTEGSHCSVCDAVIKAQEEVPAKGHTPAEAVTENEVEATCTTGGSYESVVYCSVCKEVISRNTITVDAPGHDYDYENAAADWIRTETAETVEVTATVTVTCKRDGCTTDTEGHSITIDADKVEVTHETAAELTCTEDGVEIYTAKFTADDGKEYTCSSKYTEVITATGHTFSTEWSSDETYHWHAAICEHTDEVSEKAVHTFNENGVCTICSAVAAGLYDAYNNLIVTYEQSGMDVTKTYTSSNYKTSATSPYYVLSNTESYKSTAYIILPDDVTSIGNYAFSGCSSLTGITIPAGVTSIGSSAFYDCTSLKCITIPDGVTKICGYTFQNCTSLESVTIPDGVTNVEASAFKNCTSLSYNEYENAYYLGNTTNPYVVLVKAKDTSVTSCTINDNTKVIYEYAFEGCKSLTSILIPGKVETIGNYAFSNCSSLSSVTIGSGVTIMRTYVFYKCTALESITIPDKVGRIDTSAFEGCTKLKSVTMDGVTLIGSSAFRNCTSLANITIPDKAMSIGKEAFKNCTSLTSITIGNGITEIGSSAFSGCTVLANITIPDKVMSIGNEAFSGTAYYNDESKWEDGVLYIGKHLIEAKTSISGAYEIKSDTLTIANSAFKNCTSLESITIPDSVTSIGYQAFSGCTSLTSVTFENTDGWRYATTFTGSGTSMDVSTPATNATNLTSTYCKKYWKRG